MPRASCMVTLAALPALAAVLSAPALHAQDVVSLLRAERTSPGDLEIGGEIAGPAPGITRYIRYEDLLRLPQETFTVTDDTNFAKNTTIGGVALDQLARQLAHDPDGALVVAICGDGYRTNYPRDYMAAHHPILVLRMKGELRGRWPKSESGGPLGPYLISHPFFRPSFKVLSHEDEPQIPYGVVRLEFRRESDVFRAIRPGSEWRENETVQQGFIIARQDCFRCHNSGAEGGTMAGRSWLRLAEIARDDRQRFREIIHNPKSVRPDARMPAHAGYDDATLDALTAYFRTISSASPISGRKTNP